MSEAILQALGIYFGVFVVAFISAFVPFIPIEVVIAAIVTPAVLGHGPAAGYLPEVLAIGVLAGAGQMVGKIIMYLGANRAARLARARNKPAPEPDTKPEGKLAKLRRFSLRLIEKWKDKPRLLTFVSASTGFPPFVAVALMAGAFGISFRVFVSLGMLGRSLRFIVVGVAALWAFHSL